jgi:hypothetical protein
MKISSSSHFNSLYLQSSDKWMRLHELFIKLNRDVEEAHLLMVSWFDRVEDIS